MKIQNQFTHPQSLLRCHRLGRGLSQSKLAKACGLSANDICRLEQGKLSIGVSRIRPLADYLGITIDALAKDDYVNAPPALSRVPRDPGMRLRVQRMAVNKKRVGDAGEALVAARERRKLQGTPYADAVNDGYADDPDAGFDILSFRPDGSLVYIEVKATTGGENETFYMSANERAFMEMCFREGLNYELHRVYRLNNKGGGQVAVYTAADLMLLFDFQEETYSVRRVG